jgi:putative flippase GtrA
VRAATARPHAFVLVGGVAAGVHLLVVMLAVELRHVPPAYANVIAFAVAFLVSYAGHRRYTFGAGRGVADSMGKWLAVSIAGFLLNQALYVAALRLFPDWSYLLLLAGVTVLVALCSFFLGKLWAFAPVIHEY